MSNLETAISIAVAAHRGQCDKAGKPYILHPLRVMQKCATETEMIVAVLHDVLEDTEITADHLEREGFGQDVIRALQCLTKVEGERYPDFIKRVATNPLARRVKMLDLADNMDCSRLRTFTEADAARMKRYTDAMADLRSDTSG